MLHALSHIRRNGAPHPFRDIPTQAATLLSCDLPSLPGRLQKKGRPLHRDGLDTSYGESVQAKHQLGETM